MYLEISARQTGKTSRMLDNIIETYKTGKVCIVFSFNHIHGMTIKKRLVKRGYKTKYNMVEFYTSRERYENAYKGRDKTNHVYYYDEFDFYTDDVIIDRNGYYVTTPKKTRTIEDIKNFLSCEKYDVLLHLLQVNKNKVVSYNALNTILTQYEDTILTQYEDQDELFNVEILNNWLKR
jgi:hypothetical protein